MPTTRLRSRLRFTGILAAIVALGGAGCGSASGTPPGHAATVEGAVQGFLLDCSLQSGTRVIDLINPPAVRVFNQAPNTLEGCQAVLPLAPGQQPTPELFSRSSIERVIVDGDEATVPVRAPDGSVTRAELESTPPGVWRLRPSFADREVVRGTVERFLGLCAEGKGAALPPLLTGAAEEDFVAAGGARAGCTAVVPLQAGQGAPGRELFEGLSVQSVSVQGDQAEATLGGADGASARVALERAPTRTGWDVAPSPGVS